MSKMFGNKVYFRVFDKSGKDVTDEKEWYLSAHGDLCFETNDIDMPLQMVDDTEGYYFLFSVDNVD